MVLLERQVQLVRVAHEDLTVLLETLETQARPVSRER